MLSLQNKYICNFLKCDKKYLKEIDITYLSIMDKLETKILSLKDQLRNTSLVELSNDVKNGSMKY